MKAKAPIFISLPPPPPLNTLFNRFLKALHYKASPPRCRLPSCSPSLPTPHSPRSSCEGSRSSRRGSGSVPTKVGIFCFPIWFLSFDCFAAAEARRNMGCWGRACVRARAWFRYLCMSCVCSNYAARVRLRSELAHATSC